MEIKIKIVLIVIKLHLLSFSSLKYFNNDPLSFKSFKLILNLFLTDFFSLALLPHAFYNGNEYFAQTLIFNPYFKILILLDQIV